MLNEAQTSYMLAKYLSKYPSDKMKRTPMFLLQAYGYLSAIIDATDSQTCLEIATNKRDEVLNELYSNVHSFVGGLRI